MPLLPEFLGIKENRAIKAEYFGLNSDFLWSKNLVVIQQTGKTYILWILICTYNFKVYCTWKLSSEADGKF